MSFSAATCLTFNPTIQHSDGPFDIYLNSDYTSTPFSSVTLNDISVNCPFIFTNIPTGTINLGIKDTVKNYCITIPIQDNNICSNCQLGLSDYSPTTISVITAGVLTGSCQSNITDYKINWYGPNNTTTLAFSSGSGSTFSYDYTHPLSGPGKSIPSIDGIYTPIIENVIINGYSYSNTGGTNNIPVNFLGCLPTTRVLPLTCDVRTNPRTDYPYSSYTHFLTLDISSNSPKTVESTFKISADTKYIAWSFLGQGNPDRVTITFSGSNYDTTKIGLEDIVIGSPTDGSIFTTNLTPNIYPKSANTGSISFYYRKITTLTGLTINNNDNIIIKVAPTTKNTLWDLYITCLNNFDCDDCFTNNNTNKIIGSTITGVTGNCGANTIQFKVSSCTINDKYNSDLYTYYGVGDSYNLIDTYTVSNLISSVNVSYNLFNPRFTCQINDCNYAFATCSEDPSPTSYDKTFLNDGKGVFGFTGSSQVISSYYNDWVNKKSTCWTNGTSPTSIDYYKMILMTIPSVGAPNNCGDFIGSRKITIYLHPTSTVVTGTTVGSQYYMKLTANTITNQYPIVYGSCDVNCSYNLNINVIDFINRFSTGTTTDFYGTNRVFSPIGIYYKNSAYGRKFIELNDEKLSQTNSGTFKSSTSIGNTYPFSGSVTSTIIPSLSGTICNYNQYGQSTNYGDYQRYTHYKWYYECRLTNPLNSKDFEIWASPITNFVYSGSPYTANYELAYRYSGGTVTTNPTYVI